MISIEHALLLSINVINLGIGFLVFLKNPRQRVNHSFFIFIVGMSAWAMGISLLYLTHNFLFDKVILGGGLVMFFGLMYFARVFANERPFTTRFFRLSLPILVGVALLPFNLFIEKIVVDHDGFIQPVNGPLFPLYVVLGLYSFALALYYFGQSLKGSKGKERMQMRYLVTGISIFMASVLIFNIIFPALGMYRYNLVGPTGSLIFVVLTSYTIVRHQLMDIRVVIQRSAIYSLLVSIIVAAYVGLLMLMVHIFDAGEQVAIPLSAALITIFGIATIPYIESYFQKITDRLFFKNKYTYALALDELTTVLKENIKLTRLVPLLLQKLQTIFKPSFLEFVHTNTGTIFDLSTTTTSLHTLRSLPEHSLEVEIIAHGRTIGVFTFGPKRSGDLYSSEDHMLLRTFASQAAIAFEKAEMYQELQDYSSSLEEKVHERTKEILHLQAQERQLFDDISHALQTPLTVLTSAVELLRREKASDETSTLESMARSVDDLSVRVRNLLQLARIKAMPLDDTRELFDIGQLVEAVTEYVEVIGRERDIHITSTIDSACMVDGTKKQIEELITNLLSNAVRYTAHCAKRNIYVEVHGLESIIELTVTDTGIGIPADRLPYIFDRFYRAEDNHSDTEGYGLGLAIGKSIVEQNQGTITVESTVGLGTRFTVQFPRVLRREDDEPELMTQP